MDVVPTDLTAEEIRVLGCLIEKEATTPDNYPLTLNSLRNACNQSTSREPVVSYDDRDVERALQSLRDRGLTRTVHSTSNRATKYRHVAPDVLGVDPAETALLSVLLLRGPQTVGELKGRSERQHRFDSIEEVAAVLGALASREVPLVLQLERQPGQKDARWVHLLSPPEPGAPGGDVAGGAVLDVRASVDPYGEATAEFYDLLATGEWETFGLQLLDLLADADPSVGPVVDVGAGTGAGLAYLQAAVPDARIHAVEPSKAMRTALHTRLSLDAGLCAATTVDPHPFADAALPSRACALVVGATLGHLSDDERGRLWRYVADRMPPGAPAVVELRPPDRPVAVPAQRYRERSVGSFVYEGWQEAEPLDERTMVWTMTYRVLDRGELVAEYRVRSPWRCDGVDDLRSEVAAFGLVVTEHEGCVVVRRA